MTTPNVGALALTGNAPTAIIVQPVGPITVGAGLPGGVAAWLACLQPQVIKPSPGVLVRVLIIATGSSGNLTFNDSPTLAGAGAWNQIWTIAQGTLAVGQIYYLDWPCDTGITLSSLTTGGQVAVSYG